jgi:hypothetical protein
MTAPAKGWAVAVNGVIDVRTVSPTRRAAIVNWLVTHGKLVFAKDSDEKIETMWSIDRPDDAAVFEIWVSEGQ